MSKFLLGTYKFLTLLYFTIVSDIRKSDGNALRGLFKEIMQTMVLLGVFYMMINILGLRGASVRGNFVLFLMSGIFLFMTHIKAVGKIVGTGGASNPMLKHAPVSTLLLIISAALSTLYIQILAMCVLLLIAHVMIEPIVFYNFKGFMLCFFIAWSSGASIGLLFLSLTPFLPTTMGIVTAIYQRANMIFSGKMFLASTLPGYILPMFTWNPLFHSIDQSRGYTFINYNAHVTNLTYPVVLSLSLLLIGMMIEHWARKYVSESWARRQ
jgi:ABC-type polysaccharide/polyol phosphate export permease